MAGEFKRVGNQLVRMVKKEVSRSKSQAASVINKELTATRKEIVETLMVKTGLKRKMFNDRLSITRANPKSEVIEGRLTPFYGKRIYMTDYSVKQVVTRGARTAIRLLSPLYRKNMRTGFLSKDGTKLYMRPTNRSVKSVRGRTVPTLFAQFKFKDIFQSQIMERVSKAVREAFSLRG